VAERAAARRTGWLAADGPIWKANADRRHKIPKTRYRMTNWPDYDVALVRRGRLTLWITEGAGARACASNRQAWRLACGLHLPDGVAAIREQGDPIASDHAGLERDRSKRGDPSRRDAAATVCAPRLLDMVRKSWASERSWIVRREALAVVVRIQATRAGCRSESFSEEIMMPAAKKSVPAAEKTATPAKGGLKKGAAPASKTAAPAKKAAALPKKAVPAKAEAQATITLKHIAAELAEAHDLSKKAAEAVLDDFVAVVTRQLVNGDKIRLSGLGILQVRDRPARTARNPATGEAVAVAASKKIAFRPAKELKEAV
jgi:DNA-binding protein HU-beta